mmetsp:Transcript_25569/g.70296  ORF Transcript_25569/g.70296 Transcript_25569/m.70296 type:complete len:511 (-) Transcript_25569:139-1671(-)
MGCTSKTQEQPPSMDPRFFQRSLLVVEDGGAPGPEAAALGKGRVYFLDWMRVVAIYLVVAYHVVQALDWVDLFGSVKGMKRFVVSFRATALQVGMPLFFHISGRGQALSPAAGFQKTLVRRAQRLLGPFVVAYVLLIPPWQYIDKMYDWDHPSSFHMKENFIEYLIKYWTSSRFLVYFDLAWLWFLPALFLITVLSTPLILLAERYEGERLQCVYSAITVLLWSGLALGLVLCGFTWSFAAFAVLGPTSAVFIALAAPLPPRGGGGGESDGAAAVDPWRSWCAVRAVTLAQGVADIGLVLSFGYADIDPHPEDGGHDPRAGVPFLVFCLGFYVQGYFTQRWSQGVGSLEGDSAPSWVWRYRLCVAFALQLALMISSPTGDVETGHFLYPIYSASYKHGAQFGVAHVIGTWCYIGVFVSLFHAYGENVISEQFYKHATGSTVVVYIFHWIFVKIFTFWMLKSTLWRLQLEVHSAWTALYLTLLSLLFSVGCSLLIYWLLLSCPAVGRLFGM